MDRERQGKGPEVIRREKIGMGTPFQDRQASHGSAECSQSGFTFFSESCLATRIRAFGCPISIFTSLDLCSVCLKEQCSSVSGLALFVSAMHALCRRHTAVKRPRVGLDSGV